MDRAHIIHSEDVCVSAEVASGWRDLRCSSQTTKMEAKLTDVGRDVGFNLRIGTQAKAKYRIKKAGVRVRVRLDQFRVREDSFRVSLD